MSWLIYEMASGKHRRAGAGLPDGCLFVVFDVGGRREEEEACRLQERLAAVSVSWSRAPEGPVYDLTPRRLMYLCALQIFTVLDTEMYSVLHTYVLAEYAVQSRVPSCGPRVWVPPHGRLSCA